MDARSLGAAVQPAPATAAPDDPLWYMDAIIYQVHVKAFHDSDDDGVGDFKGLTQRLDYIRDLGVNTIWVMPFYPSPLRDDGYDVADYEGVHPPYGTVDDVRRFVHEAHDRGLRVITELIMNHTSDEHPWFQAPRHEPRGSVKREGTTNENNPETHAVVKKVRAHLETKYPGRLLLAEANMWPEDVRQYFGDGDECHMAYHFPMMPRLYMSIAMEDRYPLVEIMAQTPPIPPNCQWAIFLRNHDELTLEMVTDRERDYMYRIFAGDPRMRVNVGIRRRLAPLMEGSRPKIELLTFLLMTMPGAPILYYGDEIGMGDNIYLGDRNGVRTPMQWTPDRNAGFSRADPQRLYLPPIMDPVFGYEAVNVEAQTRNPWSLLNWTRRMLAVRRTSRAFGRGRLRFLRPGNRKVLAYLRELGEEAILCVANLGRSAQPVELDLARFRGRVPLELLGRTSFPPIVQLPYLLTLPGHGYFAFRLAKDAKPPAWHEERLAPARLPVLVLSPRWQEMVDSGGDKELADLFMNMSRERLRDDVLVPF